MHESGDPEMPAFDDLVQILAYDIQRGRHMHLEVASMP